MHGCMATGTITTAALQKFRRAEAGMRHRADKDLPGRPGNLSVAFEAEIVVPLSQQFRIDGAVDLVTGHATFPDRFMLEDVRLGLLPVTLGALLIRARHQHGLGLVNISAVRVMARGAAHFAFRHRMVELQVKLRFLVEMALKTGFHLLLRIDDELAATTTGIHVQATGTVAGLATARASHALAFTGQFEPGMRRQLEVFGDFFMAGGALLRADKLRAGNQRGRRDNALDGGAGDHQRRCGQDTNRTYR